MKYNILSYFKSLKFIIVSLIYIVIFVSIKISLYNLFYKQGVNLEQYLFAENLSIFLIPDDTTKLYVLIYIFILSFPTFLYMSFVILSYFHHSFEMDSAFMFLRISRRKKITSYFIENFVILFIILLFISVYELLFIESFHYSLINYTVTIKYFLYLFLFYLLISVIMIIFQLIFGDWIAAVATIVSMIFISYGNYIITFPILSHLTKMKYDFDIINRMNNVVLNKYYPTLMNVIYFNKNIYFIIYIGVILLLILISIRLFLKSDINKEVVK